MSESENEPKPPRDVPRHHLLALQAFVLVGALLLFGVEPLVGKLVLPAYGGSFNVWTTCLTFFQGTLFLGYLYCHLLAPRLGRWHLLLLLLPLPFLPLVVSGTPDLEQPALSIILDLAASVGLPFFVLATTSVVAQCWLVASARGGEGVNPYPLYAASNLGALLALLCYPFLVEPLFSLRTQRLAWSALFLVYVVLAVFASRGVRARARAQAKPTEPIRWTRAVYWFLLSAIPSAFLLAETNLVTLDVGSFPFLWVLPLALYLSTFIFAFRDEPWCPWLVRRFWLELCLVGLFFWVNGYFLVGGFESALGVVSQMAILFAFCLVAHYELYQARPAPSGLTAYYLVISLGGWAGGLAVTFVAPLLFTRLHEYPLAVLGLVATLAVFRRHDLIEWARHEPRPKLLGSGFLLLFLLGWIVIKRPEPPLYAHRNFYGIYRVFEGTTASEEPKRLRLLAHGSTAHGMQLVDEPAIATSYFAAGSPVAETFRLFEPPRDVAVVGLGVGVLSAHFAERDRLVFYELDPDNERIARAYFSYLGDCRAKPRVVAGDARLRLTDHAKDGQYQVLVIDAFSSDAIPVHLLTLEALELYLAKLRPGGVLVIHVSNRFIDLRPVLLAAGRSLGLEGLFEVRLGDEEGFEEYEARSKWIAFSRSEGSLRALREKGWRSLASFDLPEFMPWTDEHASILVPLWWSATR